MNHTQEKLLLALPNDKYSIFTDPASPKVLKVAKSRLKKSKVGVKTSYKAKRQKQVEMSKFVMSCRDLNMIDLVLTHLEMLENGYFGGNW